MRIIVIGGTGHVGTFMVPKLIEAGAEVVVVGSGRRSCPISKGWSKARYVKCDIRNLEDINKLIDESPDVVIDMPGSAWNVYQKLKVVTKHIIACGSLWMYGEPKVVPTPEKTQNICVFESYKKRYSELLELIETGRRDGVAFTAIMPPNICGPGKIPLECIGGRSLEVHKAHAQGREVVLPDGADVLIGPCDAEDIAECFVKAVFNREKAAYQLFNVGSDYSLTATQLVQVYSEIYHVEIPVKRVRWDEYISKISPDIGAWWHFKAHMCPDISKAKRVLGFYPKYTPERSLQRAVTWMKEQGMLQ
jgi:nucleoside-diphosphate-sugar epimerase